VAIVNSAGPRVEQRYFDIEEQYMSSSGSTQSPAVAVEGVHKQYRAVHALNGVSLVVERGEFFGILGPNGAGKTTLIEIMEGLRKADSGSVDVLGQSPWPRNLALLPRLGVQTQASAFFAGLRAGEHIETVAALYGVGKERAHHTLDRVGLTGKADTLVDKLSGGQKQRLAIAAALTHEPELVFLDEPTAQLDPQARRNLWELLREIKDQGKTIVYTTHHMDEAEALCDRVAIINQGSVVAVDKPRELIRVLDSPVRLLIPRDRMSVVEARAIEGVDDATDEGASVVIATKVPAQVLSAISAVVEVHDIQTRTANLEDVYLELTGTEYQT
jgi:ABC-2 type transport system ATP-binding protein